MAVNTSALQSISRFLAEVKAAEKSAAEANTEPGSIGGATTHPVKDVDDSTEDAEEGARSEENEKDVKADQGDAGVDSTPENVAQKKAGQRKRAVDGKSEDGSVNPAGTASDDQLQIGTKKAPTGEHTAVETASAKPGKEDASGSRLGKTTHPARTDNDELDGNKYASMATPQLAKTAADLGNRLLASLAELSKSAEELVGNQVKLDADGDGEIEGSDLAELRKKKAAAEPADVAAQAGWELAGLVSGQYDKRAADSLVQQTLSEIIQTADADAEKTAEFLAAYQAELQKQAEGDAAMGGDPAAAMGDDFAAAMGGDPAAAMGGDPAAAMGGDGEGADLEQIVQLLQQLGISPEELEAAMAAEAGGGEGGEGGEEAAGGPAPEDTAGAAPGMEVTAAAKSAGKKKASGVDVASIMREFLERSRT